MCEERLNQIEDQKINRPQFNISNIERREIQSPLIACLLVGFINEIGLDRTMEIASAVIKNDATSVGKKMAEKYGGNTIEVLHRIVSEIWAEGNALEFSILEETERKLGFNVTRCRYVELYERLGIKEFGFCLSCNRDASLISGFNPRMQLFRSQTIMQGAEFCDFRIVME
jgi:fumarate reductase iron-sulfur subunit